jgi:hypothetical protein
MLLHIPGPQPDEADRIRLYDCDNGGSAVYPCSTIRAVPDEEARLAEEMRRHGSFRLGSEARVAVSRAIARRQAEPRTRAPVQLAPPAPPAPLAAELADTAAPEAWERTDVQARARERAALERYAAAAGSADAECWTGILRTAGGVRTAVHDPAAQPAGAAVRSLLLLPDTGDAEVHALDAAEDLPGAPGLVAHAGAEASGALARYRAWQRDQALRRAEDAALDVLPRLRDRFGTDAPRTTVPQSVREPEMDDVRLALLWTDDRHRPVLADRYAAGAGFMETFVEAWGHGRRENEPEEQTGPRQELERMLSARMAEKAARWFYERSYRGRVRVDDVAGEQVREEFAGWLRGPYRRSPGHRPYHVCDLELVRTDGEVRQLDVKNCRARWLPREAWVECVSAAPDDRPTWWGSTYREHCVPGFKNGRWGRPVHVVGVYSPYLGLTKLLRGTLSGDERVVVLGEVDHGTIRRLESEHPAGSGLEVRFTASKWNPTDDVHLLPPWTFSFPAECYPPPAVSPGAVERHFAAAARRWERLPDEYWPLFLRFAGPRTAPGWTAALPSPGKELAEMLLEQPLDRRGSLPDVYLAVLKHFLAAIRADPDAPFSSEAYRTCLFPRGRRDMPLGFHDPLRTLHDLVSTLTLLMEGDVRRIARFTRFRFGSAGVLQGQDGTGWKTLMFPYCGGETCPYQRLVLGKDGVGSCTKCGHLVCPRSECRFCAHGCAAYEERRPRENAGAAAAG